MTWLTWRLHRMEAMIGIPLFAGLIAIMLLVSHNIDAAFNLAEREGCFADESGALCNERVADFYDLIFRWSNLTPLLHGIPLAVAILVMLPTLQEFERGTYRLAWTQSISRRRWTLTRIGFAVAIAGVTAAIWIMATRSWRISMLRGDAPSFSQSSFDLSPAPLVGYALFAMALGIASAVVIRRLVPVLAVTTIGFVGARIFTTFFARPHYRSPITENVSASTDSGPFTAFSDRWMLDESWLSSTGQRLSWQRVNELCPMGGDQLDWETKYRACLTENGLRYLRVYQPTDRIGQFQLIETALYLGAACLLFGFAYWWLTGRQGRRQE